MKLTIPWLQKITLISIFLFMALMWTGLGRDYLYDWDEGIYGQIGSEMVKTGEVLTPTWNGDLWLEKPPMIAWVTALGIKLVGQNELGARLFMPLFAGLVLYAIFKLGERLGGTLMGSASMAILGYFNLFVSRARAVNTDSMLLAAIAWTTWLLASGAPAWGVGLAMGLAIMVKGPAGILTIFIALPLLIKKSRPYLLQSSFYLLVTILPWHLYAYLKHGAAFITPYLMEQVLRRATVPIEFHLESRWFYFNFLYKELGLGVFLASMYSLALMLKKWVEKKKLDDLFLILWWIMIPLVIFTLAKTRLSWYILPSYPGIALAIGYGLTYFADSKIARSVLSILVVGMLTQMLWHGYGYIEPTRVVSPLSEPLQIARSLNIYPGPNLAMLVSTNERVAQAILPKDQTISSSFRYGGAPSVVWYSGKHVLYYYNYDNFKREASVDINITTLIVSRDDADKVPAGFKLVSSTNGYLGYTREATYALR
jgi:4-amino-4-deoxy-L-arabinose transferase-like glycosyltransferase